MKILLLTSEEWNDKKYGNNNMTNWFTNFPNLEISHIYCSSGKPYNNLCNNYFQVTDTQMAKSLLPKGKKAGRSFEWFKQEEQENSQKIDKPVPKHLKTELVRLTREYVWKVGKIDRKALKEFIEKFQPDIVFSQRMASIRVCRMEREIHKIIPNVPVFVYTADDEYSLKQVSFNPLYWWRRLLIRSYLRKNVKFYTKYYIDSELQAKEYEKIFNVKTGFLAKCGNFEIENCHTTVNNPIKIVYTGKFYCNRWKTLEYLAKAISEVNKNEKKFFLEIYTQSPYKKRYAKWLDNKLDSEIKGRIPASEVIEKYKNADIALHVESFDLKNRLLTRYSFSTKIIDCMATGCAVMAICHPSQNALQYLSKKDAGIVIENKNQIVPVLEKIYNDKNIILEYGKKAIICGIFC